MVRLYRVFDLYNHNRAGEITVDELGPVLDTLGLDVDCASLAAIVGTYVPDSTMSLHFEDFDKLHCVLGGWQQWWRGGRGGDVGGVQGLRHRQRRLHLHR